MRPKSTGEIKLNPSDPYKSPMINFRYMNDPYDLNEMVEAVYMARDLVSQQAFDEFRGAEMKPGDQFKSEEEIKDMLRANIETAYHPSCTCRMGYDEDAVTDGEFRVHEIEGLRVVDASVMPRIVSANLNAPIQMMAARAADFILGRPQFDPVNLEYST
jgi:choline dehydrogenase